MKIAVRLDDITPDMDWKKFRRLEQMLDTYGIAPLLGVVPDNQDPNLRRELPLPEFEKQIQNWKAKGWLFAMHGWKHMYTTKKGGLFPLNSFSEFAGVAKDTQKEMILDGKEKLRKLGIETEIFMAPAHSFDSHTLAALQKAGFRYMTDGFGERPYQWKGMIFLPIAFQKGREIEKKQGYTTLVFHTNTMEESDFQRLEKVLQKHKDDFISYQAYLSVPAKKQTILGRGKEYGMAVLKRCLVSLYSFRKQSK